VSGRLTKQDDNVPEDAFDENMPMSEILAAIRESIADENKGAAKPVKSSARRTAPAIDDDILDLTVEVGPDGKPQAEPTSSGVKTPTTSLDTASLRADALTIGDDLIAMEMEDPEGDIDALLAAAEASAEADGRAGRETANEVSPIEAFVAGLVRDWLDKNMPTIVEDVVARELAKKAPGQHDN
jgi:cell pole-organizing protein PopZ